MEREAIDGYIALGRRMAEMSRPDLAEVFDILVLEETGHLSKVSEWREASGRLKLTVEVDAPDDLFDDEGAGIVAPELLTAYRAFSMAVRNEERAFMFWTYVSAHAQSDEIKNAAERMAREELGHVAKLRRERRKAFHLERDGISGVVESDLQSLEGKLSHHLEAMAKKDDGDQGSVLLRHAWEARARMESIIAHPFDVSPVCRVSSQATVDNALPLSEYLLDRYLDSGDHAKSEQDADRARNFAAQLIGCIRTVRGVDR
jgi:rubrerythrin